MHDIGRALYWEIAALAPICLGNGPESANGGGWLKMNPNSERDPEICERGVSSTPGKDASEAENSPRTSRCSEKPALRLEIGLRGG